MPDLKVPRVIVGDPDFAVTVLTNQNLERQIDSDRRRGNHEGSSGFRIAEYQKLRRPHVHAGLFRFTTVIDQGKELDSFGLKYFLQLLNGLIDRMAASYADDSVVCVRCHCFLLTLSRT